MRRSRNGEVEKPAGLVGGTALNVLISRTAFGFTFIFEPNSVRLYRPTLLHYNLPCHYALMDLAVVVEGTGRIKSITECSA